MIIVETFLSEETGRKEILVSHGVNTETGKIVTMPNLTPKQIGAVFDEKIGYYVLYE